LSIKAARLLFQIAPIRLKSVQNGWEDRSQMQISNSVERTPIELVGDIVSAYAAHNSVQRSELIGLIGSVHAVLAKLASQSSTSGEVEPEPQTPAVPIRKPITPEYLICLDDGRRLKTLKRHLNELGMTPEQYRKNGTSPTPTQWSLQITLTNDLSWQSRWASAKSRESGSRLAECEVDATVKCRCLTLGGPREAIERSRQRGMVELSFAALALRIDLARVSVFSPLFALSVVLSLAEGQHGKGGGAMSFGSRCEGRPREKQPQRYASLGVRISELSRLDVLI
jgi:predicted transcriptional regulator